MKAIELEKAYNPKDFEQRIYAAWEQAGCFKPLSDTDSQATGRGNFTVVIPPPNVTGMLHMGHGLNNALQDIVVRYHRMKGDNTLWVPGTDHAGIATQHVVEMKLKKEGLSKRDLGRGKFLERTWKVKEEHHALIVEQQKRLGNSVDWGRERFTMDEGLSKAVRDVFVTLYERDLIYKGTYLVNWCTSCGTALADDEVDHEDTQGAMTHILYQLEEGFGSIEVATTRPETMLADTAVAVHPDDERYQHLVGMRVKLSLTDRTIPIIADSYVDRAFGTGAVKITPAHDPNDWEMAKRHNLDIINMLNPDGTLNSAVPEKYRGLSCIAARKLVVEDLQAAGLFRREEKITHSVGHCYRCGTVVEPYMSEQWFVRMKPLADKALASWKRGELVFYPRKWENTYSRWLENIRDWCVSRQLWWGHRIPVWYCECGQTIVSRDDPSKCPTCGADSSRLKQDPDVLDTWFSSWLWPFSTLGWVGGRTEDGGMRNEHTELPRFNSMAEGDGTCGGDLPSLRQTAEKRDIRSDESNGAGGSLDSVEYRGGSHEKFDQGISLLSAGSKRFESGTGNPTATLSANRLSDRNGYNSVPESADRNQQDAIRINEKSTNNIISSQEAGLRTEDGEIPSSPLNPQPPLQEAGRRTEDGDAPPLNPQSSILNPQSDFATFYPTSALVTAYDIIFFWVARMIMAGLEFTGKAPFRDIYIHGLVRDKQGRKMSKSLGNGLDPLDLIAEYGADAVKFTLGFMCAQGQDVLVDRESFKLGSRFANKIWNAARYILLNLEGRTIVPVTDADLTPLDRWMYARLDNAAGIARAALESYRYNDGASALYEFFWNEFCDWYVEGTKLSFRTDDGREKDRAVSVLLNVLEESLRLLHPYLPFVTEEIWSKLPLGEIIAARKAAFPENLPAPPSVVSASVYGGMLVAAPYPAPAAARENPAVTAQFNVLQEVIRSVRGLRVDAGLAPDLKLSLALKITAGSSAEICRDYTDLVKLLAGIKDISFVETKPAKAIGAGGAGYEAFVLIDRDAVNEANLLARFSKTHDAETRAANALRAKLGGSFSQKAPAEVVAAEREKLAALEAHIEKLRSYMAELGV